MKLEHIGIAVQDLNAASDLFAKLLGQGAYKREVVEAEGVETVFFASGQPKLELLGALHEASPIAKFLAKRGEGIHHLAFEVADIEAEMERLQGEGFILLSEQPKLGADRKRICFLHPKSTQGVLIELCQSLPEV